MDKTKKILPFCIPPLLVMAVCGYCFYKNGLFPFGIGTVAWCDMSQQVIPLLCDLKDILSGKDGMFLNFQNAGGTNFWGVFFFFLSSPFSLLVAFVDKADMVYFVNILTVLKLMTASATSMVYFRNCQKKLKWYYAVILSTAYGLCGYAMLFYQNNIWLDMMYIFPLLLVSFKYLMEKRKVMPYVAVMTAFVVVNYYISYMIVLFVLLSMALFCWRYRKEEKYHQVPVLFIEGSVMAALLSAVVWLPSLIQYLSSGRTRSIIENLQDCNFITNYQTTIPMLLATTVVFVIIAVCTMDGKPRNKKINTYLIMLFLTLVPIFVEPINVMWHTGSYMSFPARYGFIAIYLAIAVAGLYLSDDEHRKITEQKHCDHWLVFIICAVGVYYYSTLSIGLVDSNLTAISNYVSNLWGNDTSFKLILAIAVSCAFVFGTIFLFYKKGLLSGKVMAIFMCAIVGAEGISSINIYMTSADSKNPNRTQIYQNVMDLSDKIEDDGFYRVGTSSKLFDMNLVGAMGYNSISHYTSLTSKDYMFAMKKLGYSSYWMEVGANGGTELTDALLSMKYEITGESDAENVVYSNDDYSIKESEFYIPLGLVVEGDFSKYQNLDLYERSDIQELLYENLLGGDKDDPIITKYYYVSQNAESFGGQAATYKFDPKENDGVLSYVIKVDGRQSLYFDCFDQLTTNLSEPINNSFEVIVNGLTIQSKYPSSANNGLLKLGEFENETVTVTVRVNKKVTCSSFGVFGLDLDKLSEAIDNVKSLNLTENSGEISGTYNAKSGEKCVLFVPYQDGISVKVNGDKVEYSKCFGDFITFDLSEGENRIEITSTPKGFIAGVIITILGAGLIAVYLIFGSKIKRSEIICQAFSVMLMGIGVILILVIYIAPMVINLFGIP
ncbi:MAG: YfhO family protein [Hominimerdicola sp.]